VSDGQLATFTSTAGSVFLGQFNGAIGQSGLLIQSGTTASVGGTIQPVGNNTAVVIQAGASLTAGSITIPSGLETTVVFASTNSLTASPSNAWLTLSSLSVTGSLTLAGLGKVVLPWKSTSVTVGSGSMVTVAGNVSLTGSLSSLPIFVGYVLSQSGDARAVNLTAGGNIYGSATDTLWVTGLLQYSGAVITPTLDVSYGATAIISSGALNAGYVSMVKGGSIIITNPSTSISFSEFTACDKTSLIVVMVSSISAMRDGTYTAARFTSVSSTQGDVACWVKLLDPSGAYVLLPHATTVYIDPEDGSSRRRLLSNQKSEEQIAADLADAYRYHAQFSTSGHTVATNGNSTFDYNNKVISYSYTKTVSYTYVSGAVSMMPTAIMSLIAMIAAIIGTRLM
jgi:hypothetical protein